MPVRTDIGGVAGGARSYVSLAVVAAAGAVAVGLPILDPLIGMVITVVILGIAWASWPPSATTWGAAHAHRR